MHLIQNPSLSFQIEPDRGCFTIQPVDSRFASLGNSRLGCDYWFGGRLVHSISGEGRVKETEQRVLRTTAHGEMDVLTFAYEEDENGIALTATFAVTREHPLSLWKIGVSNRGRQAVALNRFTLLEMDGGQGGKIRYPRAENPADVAFFSNGWQSWSPSRWYSGESRMNISKLGFLQHPMIYNPGTPLPRRRGVFSSDMFAVVGDRIARTGSLVGFLSQKNHFGSILANLNTGSLSMWANGDDARLEPGMSVETDWAVYTPILLDHRAPMEAYIEAVARENHARVPAYSPVGWCSWYHFYTNVTAKNITENLDAILEQQQRLPIELVQIDDGFEKQVGDWLEFKATFPDGVKPLAEDITHAGLLPGLWLAPFIVHPDSDLIRQHPDWILRRADGRRVNAGYVWNALATALDLTISEALQYTSEVVSTAAHEWGFPYLKLDFLYAAALRGVYHDRTKTRAQVMRMGIETLREAVGPEVTLLGCGAPLGSVLGLVDAMRIGPDVSGDWLPRFNGIQFLFTKEPAMPSARDSIHNILTRANLNRCWWVNDPDCLLIRPDTNLTLEEVHSLATAIALSGGSLLLSDDLPALPAERVRIAEVLLPVITDEVRVVDWFDSEIPTRLRVDMLNESGEWHVLGGFNWCDKTSTLRVSPIDYHLEQGEYIFREFWSGRMGIMSEAKPFVFENMPPHSCLLLACRRLVPEKAQYLGSDLHFSQGVELAEWREDEHGLEMTLRLPRFAAGRLFLRLPYHPTSALVNGEPAEFIKVSQDTFSLPVQIDGFCTVRIEK